MPILIDPALDRIPGRLREELDDQMIRRRGPLAETVSPLNEELLRRTEHIRILRLQLQQEQNKSYALINILARIHGFLVPEDIAVDGQLHRFKCPDPDEYLRRIAKAIRQIPEDLKKAEHAAPNRF